jgi:hypothetical protein
MIVIVYSLILLWALSSLFFRPHFKFKIFKLADANNLHGDSYNGKASLFIGPRAQAAFDKFHSQRMTQETKAPTKEPPFI